jgi:hypothetical protein
MLQVKPGAWQTARTRNSTREKERSEAWEELAGTLREEIMNTASSSHDIPL